ncbi:hypothetical protein L9F63_021857, partial [Diploptera punctata]
MRFLEDNAFSIRSLIKDSTGSYNELSIIPVLHKKCKKKKPNIYSRRNTLAVNKVTQILIIQI